MTIQDTCPKCGAAARLQTAFFTDYECGTRTYPKSEAAIGQTDLCRTRFELAALRTRHQRLVEAARELIHRDRCSGTEYDCYYCPMDNGQGLDQHRADCPFYNLEKALESEPSSETKPSERGCPFDEGMESEAKPGPSPRPASTGESHRI